MEKTTLYLPADIQVALRAAAKREGRSQADLVRDALTKYLAKRPQPRLSLIGAAKGAQLPSGVDSSNVKSWGREEMLKARRPGKSVRKSSSKRADRR